VNTSVRLFLHTVDLIESGKTGAPVEKTLKAQRMFIACTQILCIIVCAEHIEYAANAAVDDILTVVDAHLLRGSDRMRTDYNRMVFEVCDYRRAHAFDRSGVWPH
jgi:hypothetical protein